MKEVHAALIALPRFRKGFASRLAESDAAVRIAVFFWVCRAIKVRNMSMERRLPTNSLSTPALDSAARTVSRQVRRITQSFLPPRKDDGRRMRRPQRVY